MDDALSVGPHPHGHDHDDPVPLARGRVIEPGRAALRVGVGGPVGSGKTSLIIAVVRELRRRGREVAVITNDVYTQEDARLVTAAAVLEPERIVGVATGTCPHTAIREDVTINEAAARALERRWPSLDLLLIESGGDNLTAAFSYELVDAWICVIDVAGGDKIPRKGGPGITSSDLLVINKTDLAEWVGASVEVMLRDARERRGARPILTTALRQGEGVAAVCDWLERHGARPA